MWDVVQRTCRKQSNDECHVGWLVAYCDSTTISWERFCMASADVAALVVRWKATGKFVTMGKKARVALLKRISTREIEPFRRREIYSLNICSGQNKLLIIRCVCLVLQNGSVVGGGNKMKSAVSPWTVAARHCQSIVAKSFERLYGNRCLLTILRYCVR